jgi:hypothetical protein
MRTAGSLSKNDRELLQAHYCSSRHTATATELAVEMGFANYSAVNLHYGKFGQRLAATLKWRIPEGQPQAFSFATFVGGLPDDPDTKWILRPEVVAAVEKLGVVHKCADGGRS